MTDNTKERDQLTRLADALVEDILEAPDAEILEDLAATRGDPAAFAAQMQARFQMTLLAANKSRMRAAKAGLAAANVAATTPAKVVDMAKARQTLRRVLALPSAAQLTLAARNESELSDADVLGVLGDLQELGLWSPEDGESELS